MADILSEIMANKEKEIAEAMLVQPISNLVSTLNASRRNVRDFSSAIRKGDGNIAVIAEIKSHSPSAGTIIDPEYFYPSNIATEYERSGAAAISVLTDKRYFRGDLSHMRDARHCTNLPVLRKDFIISDYQVYESAYQDADAILLIAAAMPKGKLKQLYRLANQVGLHVLVEAHNESELEAALETGCHNIGINNRDINSQTVNLSVTERLVHLIPKNRTLVSESGIKTYEEVKKMKDVGVNAVLVGESLLRQADVGQALRELIGYAPAK